MNVFAERQNDIEQLKYQYTARVYYNRAEKENTLVWVFCIASAVVGYLGLSDTQTIISVSLLSLLGTLFGYLFSKHIEMAARLRRVFDRRVFGMETELKPREWDELKEIVETTIEKNEDDYKVQVNNTGKDNPPGVRDWYTAPTISNSDDSVVFQCQKENIWFSKKMLYAKIAINLVWLSTILFVAAIFLRGKSLWEIVVLILSSAALIGRIAYRVWVLLEYLHASIVINTLVENFENLKPNVANILLQEVIEKRRKIHLTYSNFIHSKLANKLHTRFKVINE